MTNRKNDQPKETRGQQFVRVLVETVCQNTSVAGALKRADNPSTQYQCWDTLVLMGVDLEKPWERIPFSIIATAVARADSDGIGNVPFMNALARAYFGQTEKGPAVVRLRRLLACRSVHECCKHLRPLISLIQSRGVRNVDYGKLLDDLLWFSCDQERIKARWTMDFYRKGDEK